MPRILVIEDDPRIQKTLQRQFGSEGYEVHIAGNGADGLRIARAAKPDAVILDLMLPGMSGREVCREMKGALPATPVLMLSAVSEVTDKVPLLEIGADDYITKPFSPRELLARVQAALRRNKKTEQSEVAAFGNVTADFSCMEVRKDGHLVTMTAHELKLLRYFIEHAERVVTREKLLTEVWGYHSYPTTRTVDNQVMKLRQELESNPSQPVHFRTLHGIGYKFVNGN